MKKIILTILALQFMPTIAVANDEYGALAVDRSNGFYYGWSYDYATRADANARAINECKSKGGNCSVVLELSGSNRCGAYRTIDGQVGTSYGWGKSSTKQDADNIALNECTKRSNGAQCENHVWSCNSGTSTESSKDQELDLSLIKNAVTKYYDNEGVWAGKFRIGSIDEIRVEESASNIVVHVKYEYVPLPGNTRDSGDDQRIFYIQQSGLNYTVDSMGEYMSASF